MVHGPLVGKYLQRLWGSVMDKVYLVLEEIPYEGDVVIGVYSSLESADEACEELSLNSMYSHYSVDVWDVLK